MTGQGTRDGRRPGIAAFNSKRRLYILPRWRLVYVSVPKNACTSLKWLVAELGGEDLERLGRDPFNFSPTREGLIHARENWRVVPPAKAVPDEVWQSVGADDGWFVFGVVRDPRLRLWSAWQDKYLLRSPSYWRAWDVADPDRAAAPLPTGPEEVVAAFRAFCLEVAARPGHPALQDGHFLTQVHLLNEHVVPYTRLYDMTELGELTADLDRHLTGLGHPGGLRLARTNATPFAACGALFEDGVREAVDTVYARDLERFGHLWDFERVRRRPMTWTEESFAHARSVVAANERVADLVRAARAQRRRADRLREELDECRSPSTRLPGGPTVRQALAGLAGRVRRVTR